MPTTRDAALNERMYGDLQGLNKAEAAKKWGDDQIKIWRRSYDVQPPGGESLADTAARVLPYWESAILPERQGGEERPDRRARQLAARARHAPRRPHARRRC